MFSQTVEYALRAVVAIAANPAGSMKTRDISASTKVPLDYLFKVLRNLASAGILTGGRGAGGGFALARPAVDISVLDVVNAIDPIPRIMKCPLDLPSHKKELCPLHKRMDDALEKVQEALGGATIATILAEGSPGGPFEERTRSRKTRRP